MNYSPHDLLPAPNPREYNPPKSYFYNKVIKHLIPTVIQMEAEGIPIDLSKVIELEKVVENVLDQVREKLKTNQVMLDFLTTEAINTKKSLSAEAEVKTKSYEDYLKPFDIKNKIHRTLFINRWLESNGRANDQLEEWSIKDLKKYQTIYWDNFLQAVLDKRIEQWMEPLAEACAKRLAKDKADIFNKNLKDKIQSLTVEDLINQFNPSSPQQKQKFFEFCGIESENTTKTGSPRWDRDELERIQKLLEGMLDDKS